jgi:hypothetical protein
VLPSTFQPAAYASLALGIAAVAAASFAIFGWKRA